FVHLMGDSTRLQQVMWNLLSNAVKFTDKGRIDVRLEQTESIITVSVSDTGRGIEADFLPHVFERFRQADSSPARRTRGLGPGLAIVRHLIQLHGGSVSVKSEGKNLGTTFILTLPAPKVSRIGPSACLRDEEPTSMTRLDGVSVLLVDDEADARELV